MRILYVALLAAAMVACGDNHNGPSSLTVSPSSVVLAVGDSMSVGAVFNNGDTTTPITWTSDDTSIASVTSTQNGIAVVSGLAEGATTVTAKGGGLTATVAIAVSAAQVRSIGVTPAMQTLPAAMTLQMTATGTYSDATMHDLTGQVTWSSSDGTVASISSTGLVTGVAPGTVTITASLDAQGLTGTATITVTQATLSMIQVTPTDPSLAKGTTEPLTATGVFSDSTMMNLTDLVTWASDTPGVASVDGSGVVTANTVGSASVSATLGSASGATTVTVTGAVIMALHVDPATATIGVATVQPYTATAIFTDSTNQDVTGSATWASSDPDVATIDATGSALALGSGSATISAMYAGFSDTAALTVTGQPITAISISPQNALVGSGLTIQLTATAIFADNTTQDITGVAAWLSSDPAIAQVSNASGSHGLATGTGSGTATITAMLGSGSGSTPLTVTASPLTSIAITPSPAEVPLGVPQQFTATGTFADSTFADVTQNVTWLSSDPGIATISNADGSHGSATTLGVGSATITATLDVGGSDVVGSAQFLVDPAALESIAVTPGSAAIPLGLTQQFSATGYYSDGGSADLTASVTWASGSASAVDIAPATGLATALALGSATITATDPTTLLVGSAQATATAAALESITVSPKTFDIVPTGTQLLTATGHYSDGSTQTVTNSAAWTTSGSGVAQVTTGGTRGKVTGIGVGSATITAALGSASDTAVATVDGPAVTAITPPDGLVGVRTQPLVIVAFNQPMDWTTLTAATTSGNCSDVGGTLQLSKDGFATCVGFTTAGPLATGATYASFAPLALDALATYQVKVLGSVANPAGAGSAALGSDVAQAIGFTTATDGTCANGLVISQVYGGGGNSGAPLQNDFVELHNAGATPQSLAGLSIQYSSATGSAGAWTSGNTFALPADTVPAGGYYLVELAPGAGSAAALPTPDAADTAIAVSGTAGRIALVTSTIPLVGACPLAGSLDFVGFGGANCFEGTTHTATLTNTTAALRANGGCMDTNDNGSDFTVGAPAPRNSGSADDVCACTEPAFGLVSSIGYCNLQFPYSTSATADTETETIYGRVFYGGLTGMGGTPYISMQVGYGPYRADASAGAYTAWVPMTYNPGHTGDSNDEYQASVLAPAAPDGSDTFSYTTRASRDGVNWTYCDINGVDPDPGATFDPTNTGTLTVTGSGI